jgi:hypothetical protein
MEITSSFFTPDSSIMPCEKALSKYAEFKLFEPTVEYHLNYDLYFDLTNYLNRDIIEAKKINSIIYGIKYNTMEAIKITDFNDPTHKLSEYGWTFAFYAVAYNNFIILDYLIYHPNFNINIVDNYGNSLLMIAIIYKNIDIANYLIKCNINKYIVNYYGHTAYDISLKIGCYGII